MTTKSSAYSSQNSHPGEGPTTFTRYSKLAKGTAFSTWQGQLIMGALCFNDNQINVCKSNLASRQALLRRTLTWQQPFRDDQ
jgi:hypothetical protein